MTSISKALESFIALAFRERRLRCRDALPAHTPEQWHHDGVAMSRARILDLLADSSAREQIQRRFAILPTAELVGCRTQHFRERKNEILLGKANARTPDNSAAISEYRKGDLDEPLCIEVSLERLFKKSVAGHPKAMAAPYGIVWHARYIAKHGRFWRPPVLVERSRTPFFIDGNHRYLAALLVTNCVGRAEVVVLRRKSPRDQGLW